MKKHLILIGSTIIAVIVILLTLNFTTDKPNEEKNGFNRNVVNKIITEQNGITIPLEVKGIAGINGDTVYLQTNIPGKIYLTNDFKTLDTIRVPLPEMPILERAFVTHMDYPKQFIIGYNAKKVIEADHTTGKYKIFDTNTPGPVKMAVYIGNHQYVLRSTDTTNLNCAFYRINLGGNKAIKETNISDDLGDAGFIHEGLLLFDQKSGLFTYTEYYSNNIVIFDTSLKPINRYHTIDTFSTSGMHVKISSTGVTNDLPPRNTNGAGGLSDGILYVRSYLIGDNEDKAKSEIRIDRYSVKDGAYLNSFYLPNPRHDKLLKFTVANGYVYALFEGYLKKLKINTI